MFKQIIFLLTLIPFHLSASNAGAAAAASPSATPSAAEHDEKDRKGQTEAAQKQMLAIGEKIKSALKGAAPIGQRYSYDLREVESLQRAYPHIFNMRCCQAAEGLETPFQHAVRMHPEQTHIIAFLIPDAAELLSDPDATGVSPIFQALGVFVRVPMVPIQVLLFDVDHPNARDGNGNTILHIIAQGEGIEDLVSENWNIYKGLRPVYWYPYQAARYFVAHGLNPEACNSQGKTALECVKNENAQAMLARTIAAGQQDFRDTMAARRAAIVATLTTHQHPLSNAFNEISGIIQAYVGTPRNQQIAAIIQQLKTEAPRTTMQQEVSAYGRIMKLLPQL